MTAIGETLRRERTKRSLDLKSVSSELKISQKFLEAIEAEAFDKLPGGMFAKSFVRQYARYLGLDEDDMAAELDRVVEPTTPALSSKAIGEIEVPRVEEWQALNDRFGWSGSLPALAMVVVVMLVCSGVYSWWQRSRASAIAAPQTAAVTQPVKPESPAPAPSQAQQQPQAPVQTQPEAQQPAAQASPAERPAPPKPTPAAPAQTTPQVSPETPVPPPQAAAAKPHQDVGSADRPAPEATPAPANPAPGANPVAGATVKVELTASEPGWVLAQADGKYSFSGTLEANQTRSIEATGKIVLRLGNAGGVTITLNGKPIGAVGAKGQVKTIQLTSGGWTAAVSKPSLPVDDIL
jgi:cytoskeleton protein RodZ